MSSSSKPQKPFSRSAAKRESVMALGSIEHLQNYFTKAGLASKKNPLAEKYNLKPAIGGLKLKLTSPTSEDTDMTTTTTVLEFPLDAPEQAPIPHVRNVEIDPESLLPGIIDDLVDVSHTWRIDTNDNPPPSNADEAVDVLATLKTTTRAIRSVRNYVLSLPDESAGTVRAQFRPKSLSVAAPRKSDVTTTTNGQPDPLALIRRAALEVLTVLRDLEERSRVPLSDDAYDAQSDSGSGSGTGSSSQPPAGAAAGAKSHSRVASPSNLSDSQELPSTSPAVRPLDLPEYIDPDVSITYITLPGKLKAVPVWEDEENPFATEEQDEEKKERWDEKLVLQSGWLYKRDVHFSDLVKEKNVVKDYLDVVDEVLFRKQPGSSGERGWEKEKKRLALKTQQLSQKDLKAKRRRTSTGDVERALGISSRSFLGVDSSSSARRRVTMGVIPMLDGLSLSEEPELEPLGVSKMPALEEEHLAITSPSMQEAEDDEEDIDESELPAWARIKTSSYSNELDRAYALLVSLLPINLLSTLIPPSSEVAPSASLTGRLEFLESLSSGQLLCAAYNTGVRKSRKPWGFVAKDGIHDIIALERQAQESGEEKAKKGPAQWTFRRTDNLRLFVGALKLRYGVSVLVPPRSAVGAAAPQLGGSISQANSTVGTPVGSPTALQNPVQMLFDPKIVASRMPGWDTMLEELILKWVEGVVWETRSER